MSNYNQANDQPNSPYYTEQPVSMGEWLGTMLLMCIPVVNIILMFVWAFGGSAKVSKRNYFRASLLLAAIVTVLWIVAIVVMLALGGSLGYFGNLVNTR